MNFLDKYAEQEIKEIANKNLYRELISSDRLEKNYIFRNGKKLINFSSNDYFGLADHPDIKQAAIAAIEKYGFGSSSSRLISGDYSLYHELEEQIAKFKKTDSSIVFGSGYLANIGTITSLLNKDVVAIADKNIHACMIDAIKLSGAKLVRYKHNNFVDCEEKIKQNLGKKIVILTESIFSMDGTICDFASLEKILNKYNIYCIIDDAHGINIANFTHPKYIITGTFSKSLASYGGYVCSNNNIIKLIQNKARSLIFSTSLPYSNIAASIKALDLIQDVESPIIKSKYFASKLKIKSESQIVPIILGDSQKCLDLAKYLEKQSIYVSTIRPPAVKPNSSRIRININRNHKTSEIDNLIKHITEFLK